MTPPSAPAILGGLLLAAAGALPPAADALPPAAGALPPAAARLERAMERVVGVSASFVAVRTVELTGEELTAHGEVAFRAPDRFRLAYLEPDRQEIVVEGDSLWVVLLDENQAMRFAFDPEAPGSEVFLMFGGRAEALRGLFRIEEEPWAAYEDALHLTPLADDGSYPLEELRLVVDENGFPRRLFYREITGDTVAFRFTGITANPADLDERVRLILPPGIEIIDGEALSAD